MKFLIAVDLEGVACAYGPYNSGIEDSFNIEFVRKQATREANAAVKALFDSGADEVIVWDNHGRGCSLYYDQLDERCLIAIGSTVDTRYPCLDESFSGVLFIGYHGMAGSEDAVLAHTFSSVNYQYIKINGKEYGEVGIDSAIAGEFGVPVIFLSGDDKVISEAKEVLPDIETVETKKSLAYTRIISKHPKRVEKEIYEGVLKAVSRSKEMKVFRIDMPVEVEIRYRRADVAKHARLTDKDGKNFEQTDAYTRKGFLNSIGDVVFKL